jgi:hypothetical protein
MTLLHLFHHSLQQQGCGRGLLAKESPLKALPLRRMSDSDDDMPIAALMGSKKQDKR